MVKKSSGFEDPINSLCYWYLDRKGRRKRNWFKTVLAHIVNMRSKNSLPTTERHIMYLLETKGFLDKKKKQHTNSLSKVLTQLRERKEVLNSEIIDESREIVGKKDMEKGTPLDFLKGFMVSIVQRSPEFYSKSLWKDQGFYPIFIVEKEALIRLFTDTLEPYRVRVLASRGNCSYPQMMELISILPDNLTTEIFLFSDCDYAGYDDERDLNDRINEYTKDNPKAFIVRRVALTDTQVLKDYSSYLVGKPLNTKDTRAKNYPNLKVSCELDGLETKDLKDLIIQSVESCITNRRAWNTARAREKWGKKAIQQFSKTISIFIGKQQIYP